MKEAVEAHPGRVNPKAAQAWSNACAYTSAKGTVHCIAGQVLKDFGLPIPKFEDYANSVGIDTLADDWNLPISGEALAYLRVAQYVFDGGDVQGGAPRRWNRAYKLLTEQYDKFHKLVTE